MKKLKIKSDNAEVKISIKSASDVIKKWSKQWGYSLEDIRGKNTEYQLTYVRSMIAKELKEELNFGVTLISRTLNKSRQTIYSYINSWQK